MTTEERSLLKRLASGVLDGVVGDDYISGKSIIRMVIKEGKPIRFREGPGRKVFNGKENDYIADARRVLQEWITDEEILVFLRKYGFLMKDEAVKAYSAKFKP